MAPAPLTEQGHHLCSLWSRGRKGHAHRACAAPLAVGMVQVGCVLLNPHMHPKNTLVNAAHSSQGLLTLKGDTAWCFPCGLGAAKREGGCWGRQGEGTKVSRPWGITAKNPSEEG